MGNRVGLGKTPLKNKSSTMRYIQRPDEFKGAVFGDYIIYKDGDRHFITDIRGFYDLGVDVRVTMLDGSYTNRMEYEGIRMATETEVRDHLEAIRVSEEEAAIRRARTPSGFPDTYPDVIDALGADDATVDDYKFVVEWGNSGITLYYSSIPDIHALISLVEKTKEDVTLTLGYLPKKCVGLVIGTTHCNLCCECMEQDYE